MSEPERIYERTICKLLCFNLFWNVIYSGDAKLNLQHHYCGKSEIILICCSINISSYYQCWKHSLPCNCGHSDAPLPARMLVLCYVLYGSTSTLWDRCVVLRKRKDRTILKIKQSNVIAKIKGCIQTVFQNIPTTLAPICYCLDEPIVSPKVTPLVEQEFDKWRCFESISKATVSHYSRNHPMNFLNKHYYKKKNHEYYKLFNF